MGFGVELAVRQHQSNGQAATGGIQQAGQSTRVAPRALSRPLRQNDLAIHIGNQQPLQIVSIARLPAGMLLDATDEVRADRVLRQPGAIDGHTSPPSAAARAAAQSAHRFSQHVLNGVVRQPPQEAIHGGVVRHARQSQHGAQLAMLAQTHFGLTKGPVRVAHQTKDRQQLRLGELVFAETTSVGRPNRSGYIQATRAKGRSPISGIPPPASLENIIALRLSPSKIRLGAEDVNRAGLRLERKHEWLLRQYFPKGTDLSGYTQSDLDKVALRLNQRPRKTLGFQTPASTLRASVASTC